MAGKHRQHQPGETERYSLRLPPALKAHLEDVALSHGQSLNEEIVERLMQPRYFKYSRETWAALMALEPGPGDTRRTVEEIAAQIAAIKKEPRYRVGPEDPYEDVEMDWLPGSVGKLYNERRKSSTA